MVVAPAGNSFNKEVAIRRRITNIYNKREEDFPSLRDYNDYLEEVEDMTYKLVEGIDVPAIEANIAKYQEENAEQIINSRARKAEELAKSLREHQTQAATEGPSDMRLSGRGRQPFSRTTVPTRRMHAICSAKERQESPLLLKLAVGLVTELLRIFTASQESSSFASGSTTPNEVSVADIDDVIAVLESDYKQSYFLTGEFTKSIYAEDCWFIDPTIKFEGRDLYQRNLQLLVPFFVNPSLLLCGIEQGFKGDAKFIKAKWHLRTNLKLPWRPLISLEGSTIYDLDDNLKIVYHVESWNISAFEAITQMFLPSSNDSFRK